jgi:hypothetical protein
MKKPRLRIYLDTSVISYHTARLRRDPVIRRRQLTTRKWWDSFRERADFCISTYVLEEISDGDPEAANSRMAFVEGLSMIVSDPHSEELGQRMFRNLKLPHRSRMDGFHLAVAALNRLDYIVSWNFKHMANAGVQAAYEQECTGLGLWTPIIVTPDYLLETGGQDERPHHR